MDTNVIADKLSRFQEEDARKWAPWLVAQSAIPLTTIQSWEL